MKSATILVCMVALLACSSVCYAARPDRHLAQAIAKANAVANEGETVVANSGATSTGDLTVSDVSAKGAGPGTTVNCEQQAKNGEVLSKECGGTGEKAVPAAKTAAKTDAKSTAATTTTNAEAKSTATTEVSWDNAPACKGPLSSYTPVFGTGNDNRPWGFEEDTKTSCALKDANGKALVTKAAATAKAATPAAEETAAPAAEDTASAEAEAPVAERMSG